MVMKFNIEKIKGRLEGQDKKSSSNNKADFVKPKTAGKHLFRAVPYPHSEDPLSEPFVERSYHYGIGDQFTVACPKNQGNKCHICDYVWDRIKAIPGSDDRSKQLKQPWFKKLPSLRVWLVGKLRGAEDEGTPKFFGIGSREKVPSPNHKKLIEWFADEDTATWLDPDQGIDMELQYEELAPGQKKLFKSDVGLESFNLARKSSKFGEDYKEFMSKIKNIDDIYPVRTTEDTLEILQKWQKLEASQGVDPALVEDDEEGLVVEASPDKSLETTQDALQDKLNKLGL